MIYISGTSDAENIRRLSKANVDVAGFIFIKGDKRYVKGELSYAGIIPDRADSNVREEIRRSGIKTLGIFADEMPQTVITQIYNYRLDYIRLDGSESPVYIENLRRTLVPDIVKDIKIIKSFTIEQSADTEYCREYEGMADMFLFRTKSANDNQAAASAYKGNTPFLLETANELYANAEHENIDNPLFAGFCLDGICERPMEAND